MHFSTEQQCLLTRPSQATQPQTLQPHVCGLGQCWLSSAQQSTFETQQSLSFLGRPSAVEPHLCPHPLPVTRHGSRALQPAHIPDLCSTTTAGHKQSQVHSATSLYLLSPQPNHSATGCNECNCNCGSAAFPMLQRDPGISYTLVWQMELPSQRQSAPLSGGKAPPSLPAALIVLT